jgi:hypothetical protein
MIVFVRAVVVQLKYYNLVILVPDGHDYHGKCLQPQNVDADLTVAVVDVWVTNTLDLFEYLTE